MVLIAVKLCVFHSGLHPLKPREALVNGRSPTLLKLRRVKVELISLEFISDYQ